MRSIIVHISKNVIRLKDYKTENNLNDEFFVGHDSANVTQSWDSELFSKEGIIPFKGIDATQRTVAIDRDGAYMVIAHIHAKVLRAADVLSNLKIGDVLHLPFEVERAMYAVSQLDGDEYGLYVWDDGHDQPVPWLVWFRNLDPSDLDAVYYVGSVIDYHT